VFALLSVITSFLQFRRGEDVLGIMMRMKEIVLKAILLSPQIGRLLVTGPATVRRSL